MNAHRNVPPALTHAARVLLTHDPVGRQQARLTGGLSRGLRETTYSFRKLSQAEAARLKPLRLRIHRVRPGESAARIAAGMPFEDHRLRRFLVLNGLARDQKFPSGHRVKTVIE